MRNGLLMLVLVMGVSALLYTWLGASSQTPTPAIMAHPMHDRSFETAGGDNERTR